MTKLRGYIPTMLMLVTLMFGATAANAGIIITNRTETASTSTDGDPCKEDDSSLSKFVGSVATFLKTGIIITNRTGIIITNRDSQDTCGIIITN